MAPDDTMSTAVAPAPILTRDALLGPTAEPERAGGPLLAILVLLAGVLVTVVIHADIEAIGDDGWRTDALWAVGVAVVLLGLALAAVAWTIGSADASSTLPRVAVLAAVIGVVGAVLVVGVADEQGGELASSASSVAPTVVDTTVDDRPAADVPLRLDDALDPEHLAPAAIPITVRAAVTITLNQAGRELFAAAMSCRPADFVDRGLVGTAIGGTWAQPLLLVGAPFDADGEEVARCHVVVIRLPIAAGTVRPGF